MTASRTILLPTDGSATAEAAARFVEEIARAGGACVLVLGVARRAFVGSTENYDLTAAVVESVRETVEQEAARIRQSGVECESLVVVAESEHAGILEVASARDVRMIVMGTHGRSLLARAILGSVADRVLRYTEVPLVLVPLVVEGG